MIFSLFKLFQKFEKKIKTKFVFILILMLISMVFEIFGLGLIFPLIESISSNEISKYTSLLIVFIHFFVSEDLHDLILLNQSYRVVAISLIIFILFTFKFLIMTLITFLNAKIQYGIQAYISAKLFHVYLIKKYQFYMQNNSATLTRNITHEIDQLIVNVIFPILIIITDSLMLIGICIALIVIQPTLSIFAITTLLFFGSFFLLITKNYVKKLGILSQKLQGEKLKIFSQSLKSIKEISIYGKTLFVFNNFNKFNMKYSKNARKQYFISFFPQPLFEYLAIISLVLLILFFLFTGVSNSQILATLGLFVAAIFRSIPASFRIISCTNRIIFGLPAVNEILKHLDTESLNIKLSDKSHIANFSSNNLIELNNVSYKYPNKDKNTLSDINLKIKKNEIIGIKGISGSGKTTLINLIIGLIEPNEGKIIFNFKNKNNNNLSNRVFSYVPQEVFLWDDTIVNNITFLQDNKKVNIKKLNNALKISELDKFVEELEEKENTIVGENGFNLSGGQKQRLGIARAIYNNSSILILDEATSALDQLTENKIISNLFNIRNLTIILISHKSSIIRLCHKVIEVKRNKIYTANKR